jgi:hypothetical protein
MPSKSKDFQLRKYPRSREKHKPDRVLARLTNKHIWNAIRGLNERSIDRDTELNARASASATGPNLHDFKLWQKIPCGGFTVLQ